jgi:glycosyltransferase domain-containing protein
MCADPMLEHLTLVIPSYERQGYALRAMNYWSGRGPQVHVFDGSKSPLSEIDLTGIGINVHYHHQPQGLYSRLASAIPAIKTKYCALISDDEFYLPSSLEVAINWLDHHKDYVVCAGQAVRFLPADNRIFWRPDYPQFENYSVADPDPLVRMSWHMRNYAPTTIYGVARSDDWKAVMGLIVNREFPVYAIGELQFEVAMAFKGKSVALPDLMWVRSEESNTVRRTDPSLFPERRFDAWWDSAEKSQEKQEMLELMSTFLVDWSDLEKIHIKDGIEDAFMQYRDFLRARKKTTRGFLGKLIAAAKWRTSKLIFPKTYSLGGVWFGLDKLMDNRVTKQSPAVRRDLEDVQNVLNCYHYSKLANKVRNE